MNGYVVGGFLIFFCSITSLTADYFDNQGNTLGRFRTEYNSQTEGSSSNPLDIGPICLYPDLSDQVPFIPVSPDPDRCPNGPTVYPGGPYPYSNVPFNSTSFFVLTANVEFPSFGTAVLGGGSQGQGAPHLSSSLTGAPDLFAFYSLPVFQYLGGPIIKYKASLLIDNEGTNGAKFDGAIPYLSIGAHNGRGNASRVGRMNVAGAPKRTTWKSTVNMATATVPDVNYHFVMAHAYWGGKPRMLIVLLYHFNYDYNDNASDPGGHFHWNWPALNSLYYPGADIAGIDAEDIVTQCGTGVGTVPRTTSLGVKTSYSLNWEALYRCMSDKLQFDTKMPTSKSVDINGVHWGVELGGPDADAAIWVIVEDMFMAL